MSPFSTPINGTFASPPEGMAAIREILVRVRGEQERNASSTTRGTPAKPTAFGSADRDLNE
jgi:hypothetical protein